MSQQQGLRAFGVELFDRWTAMWNGNTDLALEIMAPWFMLRYAQANTEFFDDVHTPAELIDIIKRWHVLRPGIEFAAEGDAAIDLMTIDGMPAGRVAHPYLAVFTDPAGQRIARSGIDMLAVRAGRISEVWSVSSGTGGRMFYRR